MDQKTRLDSLFQNLQADLDSTNVDSDITKFAIDRLRSRMRKRAEYKMEGLEQACLEDFKNLNNSLKGVTVNAKSFDILNESRYFIMRCFENYNTKRKADNIQITLDESILFDFWSFGPGASNGVRGTHAADKINQKMTCTKAAEHLVSKLRRSTPYFVAYDAANSGGLALYKGSKLATVPKNEDAVRIIAIEPSGNMCLQLAAGKYIEDVLRGIGLDIKTQQPKNQELARKGSKDGSIATIDLSKASDMFTPELVRLLMPEDWFNLLMVLRSPVTEINGEEVELNMISTMGNGFTFPLMTLCLVSLIYGFRRVNGGPANYISWKDTAVFGDDIILPVKEYDGFTELLGWVGLVVNHDKSYSVGDFRESCGGDYKQGFDVKPFYAKSLITKPDVYVVINQVLEWSAKHVLLSRTLSYLATLIQSPFFVPVWSNPDQGILTTQVETRYKFLQPQLIDRQYSGLFLVPLAIAGYVKSQGPDAFFTPRQYKTRYVVRRGRLPKGFLSGHDPLKRSVRTDALIDLYTDLFFR